MKLMNRMREYTVTIPPQPMYELAALCMYVCLYVAMLLGTQGNTALTADLPRTTL